MTIYLPASGFGVVFHPVFGGELSCAWVVDLLLCGLPSSPPLYLDPCTPPVPLLSLARCQNLREVTLATDLLDTQMSTRQVTTNSRDIEESRQSPLFRLYD
jgi:hypothetical protein